MGLIDVCPIMYLMPQFLAQVNKVISSVYSFFLQKKPPKTNNPPKNPKKPPKQKK